MEFHNLIQTLTTWYNDYTVAVKLSYVLCLEGGGVKKQN